MTDWLLSLIPQYGLWLLVMATFLSCLALPLPASILMLTAGGFAAAGELGLTQTLGTAVVGAVAGDQLGYWIGRRFGSAFLERLRADPARDRLLARASGLLDRQGLLAVFLSRWLISPLGPWVNLIAGSARYSVLRFTFAGALGEAVWAGLYVGAGYGFAGKIEAASEMLGSVLGMVVGAAAVAILGVWLFGGLKHDAHP